MQQAVGPSLAILRPHHNLPVGAAGFVGYVAGGSLTVDSEDRYDEDMHTHDRWAFRGRTVLDRRPAMIGIRKANEVPSSTGTIKEGTKVCMLLYCNQSFGIRSARLNKVELQRLAALQSTCSQRYSSIDDHNRHCQPQDRRPNDVPQLTR